jgi:hypothetical protein
MLSHRKSIAVYPNQTGKVLMLVTTACPFVLQPRDVEIKQDVKP